MRGSDVYLESPLSEMNSRSRDEKEELPVVRLLLTFQSSVVVTTRSSATTRMAVYIP
jgi:hypothetical protein